MDALSLKKNLFFTTLVADGTSIDGILEGFLKSEGHFNPAGGVGGRGFGS